MSKKDFFIIIIKLFGLYALITTLFYYLPSNISAVISTIVYNQSYIYWMLAAILIPIVLFTVLLFKTEKIVDLLKLDKGFESDHFEIGNLNIENILKLATVIIGGLFIINNLSNFIYYAIVIFKNSALEYFEINLKDKVDLIISGINVLIGILIITNYNFIAKLLNNK